jgi:D-amino-acid dehydrogenase
MSRTVVIGAGVIGLACAHALRKRGDDVVVIEQGTPGEACSRGNAGWIVPSLAEPLPAPGLTGTSLRWMLNRDSPLHIDPWTAPRLAGWLWAFWRRCNTADYRAGRAAWAQLTEHVLESFDALVADGVAVEMHCSGVLFVYMRESTMRDALHEMTEFRRPDAPTIQPLVGDELRRFEPALRADVRAGFWVPEERHVRPESLCAGLLHRIAELGVEVQTGTAVVGGTLDGGTLRAVRTAHGDVTGDRFLIAAGAWSGLVSERIARISLPVQAGKGYSVTVTAAQPPIQRPMYLSEARVGCTPFVGGYRYAAWSGWGCDH